MLWRTGHTAASEVQANYRWTDKQISSRSEYHEYAAPTAAPPTTMAALRTNSPSSNQSLLGTAPSGSTLVQESNHSTFYASPLSDVTKTVQHWIAAYESDGGPNAAPILYRYLEQASVNVSAWVEKVGYVFNGSSTLRSKSTFTESDQGTIETYRGLERQEPNSFNHWTVTYAPVEIHTGGITQTITHSKPAADNTITLPGQGTTTTVAPGGEHHAGTSTLATSLTVQQPLAEFVGQFSTKTGYVSNSVVSPGHGGLSDAGEQDTGPGTGDETDSDSADQIASKLAEIETLMREGLANANRLSLEQLKSLATGTYHSVYDPELGMFAIKPMASDRWYLFESYTAPTGQAAAPTHARFCPPVQMGVYWRLRGWEPGELNPDLVKEGYQLRRDQAFWNGAKDATEFTLHLLPGGSFVDKVAGESDDSWAYVLFVSAGDCLMLAGCFVKAGTRGARIVNGLSIGENLGGAGLAGYQGLGENGQYSHGGDFVLRLVAVGLGARNVQLKQKLGELGELGARGGVLRSGDEAVAGALSSSRVRPVTNIDEMLESGVMPGQAGVVLDQRYVRFADVHRISARDVVEYVLTRENGSYILRSGGQSTVSIPVGVRPIVHTHPADITGFVDKIPSRSDINVLNQLWDLNPNGPRPVSQIIWGSGPGETTIFRATGHDLIPKPKVRNQ